MEVQRDNGSDVPQLSDQKRVGKSQRSFHCSSWYRLQAAQRLRLAQQLQSESTVLVPVLPCLLHHPPSSRCHLPRTPPIAPSSDLRLRHLTCVRRRVAAWEDREGKGGGGGQVAMIPPARGRCLKQSNTWNHRKETFSPAYPTQRSTGVMCDGF